MWIMRVLYSLFQRERAKMKLSRKQKQARAELKRKELYIQIIQYMNDRLAFYSSSGKLNAQGWIQNGENYIIRLLKEKPQEAEMIRQVSKKVEKTLIKSLEAAIESQKEVQS